MLPLLVASLLSAHVGQDQFGKFPFVFAGDVVGGGTSWGLVREAGEVLRPGVRGSWERVCEEAFGPVVYFAVDQRERGVLMGGIDGLSRTSDGGCSYDVVENALEGEFVSASWFDPGDPAHIVIGTSTNSATNGLWESNDGGDTFVELLAPRAGSFFNVTVSLDGEFIAATGNDGQGNARLLMSDDAGVTFVDASDVVTAYPIVHALLFDGHDLLIGGLQPSTQGFIDRVVFDGVDATGTRIGETPREVRQAAIFKGDLYVISNNGTRGELYRENDSALGFGAVDGGPTECVFPVGDTLFGCGKQSGLNSSLFLQSLDGTLWTEKINFQDIQYQVCPEGTVGRTACATFVELFCGDGVDDDFGDGTDCDDPDCDTNPLCTGAVGEGEGEAAEGEGDAGGEGEGEEVGEEGEGEGAEGEGEAAEGEGDAGGEGEGEEGEGEGAEGEGDGPAPSSCCTGSPATVGLLGLVLLRRRRGHRGFAPR